MDLQEKKRVLELLQEMAVIVNGDPIKKESAKSCFKVSIPLF